MKDSHLDPLSVAELLGRSVAGNLGAEDFTELELSYVSGVLPRFSDNPIMRVRQNLLLYRDQSYFKSTSINAFAQTIPAVLVVDITSLTPQTLFGSISESRKFIIRPAFAGKRFALITELLSFIGSGNTMKDIVNAMNKIMEGEPVSRRLLKLAEIEFDRNQIERLKQEGIHYDPYQGQLSYQPDVCIIGASRPMDNKTYTYIRSSGHAYRYHIIQHEISDREAMQYLTENFYPDLNLLGRLKVLNEHLGRITVKNMRLPRKPIMEKIFTRLIELVADEIGQRRLAEVIDIRTRGDIAREITCYAVLRSVAENGFSDIERLEYTGEDVEFILRRLGHFVEFKINPLFVQEWTMPRIRKRRPKDQAEGMILELLSDGNVFSRNGIIQNVRSKMAVSTATIDNALRELVDESRVYQPEYGFYKLSGGD